MYRSMTSCETSHLNREKISPLTTWTFALNLCLSLVSFLWYLRFRHFNTILYNLSPPGKIVIMIVYSFCLSQTQPSFKCYNSLFFDTQYVCKKFVLHVIVDVRLVPNQSENGKYYLISV